jgi:PPOX class probable FMN-dependent enzyme
MFADALTETSQLREHYREPNRLVRGKITDALDEHCRDFIARSTFVLVASTSSAGHVDVSPKGGPQGFVKVLDEHRLAIPDLNGNNLLDSLHNIIETGEAGLLFVVPGLGETLRVNGAASVTTDPAVLDLFTDDVRRPVTAIGITVREAYIHCAKSFRRGGIWQPETWPEPAERPSAAAAFISHVGLEGTKEEIESAMEQGYRRDLEADQPVS